MQRSNKTVLEYTSNITIAYILWKTGLKFVWNMYFSNMFNVLIKCLGSIVIKYLVVSHDDEIIAQCQCTIELNSVWTVLWTGLSNNYKCQNTMLWESFCQHWHGLLLNWPQVLMQAHVLMNNSEEKIHLLLIQFAADKRATECKWIVTTDQIDLNGFGEIGSSKKYQF